MLKNPISILLAFGSVIACAAGSFAADVTPAQPASRYALRHFVLTGVSPPQADPNAIPQIPSNPSYVGELSARLRVKLDPDAKALLGQSILDNSNYLSITTGEDTNLALPNGSIALDVSVNLDGTPATPAAEPFMEKVAAAIPTVVADLDAELRSGIQDSLNTLSIKRDKLQAQLNCRRDDEHKLQAQLADAGIVDANPADIHALAQKLDDQRQNAGIDRAAILARKEAVTKTIADLTAQAAKKAGEDEVSAQLQKVVTVKEQKLKRAQDMNANGMMSQGDLNNILADVAEARVRLLERKEAVAKSSGGDAIAQLQSEVRTLTINATESEAREIAAGETAKNLVVAQQLGGSLAEIEQNDQALLIDLTAVKNQVDQLQSQIDSINHKIKPVEQN